MTKKEQKIFVEDLLDKLKENGVSVGFFLKTISVSRTHWYFIKKGERTLTDQKIQTINSFQNERLMFSEFEK